MRIVVCPFLSRFHTIREWTDHGHPWKGFPIGACSFDTVGTVLHVMFRVTCWCRTGCVRCGADGSAWLWVGWGTDQSEGQGSIDRIASCRTMRHDVGWTHPLSCRGIFGLPHAFDRLRFVRLFFSFSSRPTEAWTWTQTVWMDPAPDESHPFPPILSMLRSTDAIHLSFFFIREPPPPPSGRQEIHRYTFLSPLVSEPGIQRSRPGTGEDHPPLEPPRSLPRFVPLDLVSSEVDHKRNRDRGRHRTCAHHTSPSKTRTHPPTHVAVETEREGKKRTERQRRKEKKKETRKNDGRCRCTSRAVARRNDVESSTSSSEMQKQSQDGNVPVQSSLGCARADP